MYRDHRLHYYLKYTESYQASRGTEASTVIEPALYGQMYNEGDYNRTACLVDVYSTFCSADDLFLVKSECPEVMPNAVDMSQCCRTRRFVHVIETPP
jgi:hypothetical protein